MLTVDGSQGEGGGQVLRSALSLSMVTGKPVAVSKIRAGRKRPGLLRQHLTAAKAATEICGAELTGASIGSREVRFRPGKVRGGEFHFRIGTAGSTSLVLQTVLPALLLSNTPSKITLEGGTHNVKAPPFDFLQQSFLPLVNQLGPHVEISLERAGFYPAGGGCVHMTIEPTDSFDRFELMERGKLLNRRVRALLAHLPDHIGRRECSTLCRELQWSDDDCQIVSIDNSVGPGNVLLVEVGFENITETFSGFGEKRKRAESVAKDVVSAVNRYLATDAPIGEHLADQIMLPLAIGA